MIIISTKNCNFLAKSIPKLCEPDNCIHCCNVAIVNIFDPELLLIKTKPMTKSKLKNCSVS